MTSHALGRCLTIGAGDAQWRVVDHSGLDPGDPAGKAHRVRSEGEIPAAASDPACGELPVRDGRPCAPASG
jgi:hypothetical protein